MKKVLITLGLIALVGGSSVSFFSCNKIKDEIAKQLDPFNFEEQNITYDLPVLTATGTFTTEETSNININQMIKDEAGVDFDIDDVSSIKIKKITLTLLDATNESNWTNVESATVVMQTKTGKANGKPTLIASETIEDVESARFTPVVIEPNDINLKEYFNGDGEEVTYYLSGVARRPTDKTLKINAVIEYEIKF